MKTNLATTCAAVATACLATAGCMLSPTDDQIVSSTTGVLNFQGYLTQPNAPVNVRAWNYVTHAMQDVGPQVRSGTAPVSVSGGPLYAWSAPRALPAAYWRTGPLGGQCAAVGAQTTSSSARQNMMTVEQDWGSCWTQHPSVGEFYGNCQADSSPVAKLYTSNWGEATVNQGILDVAAILASGQISLVFDNFTPTQGQFCNSGNPGGCPPGLSSDPETYQFYQPNASSITQTGQPPLTFSITPTRQSPLTVYIDDLRSRRLTFGTSGARFVLGIQFEEAGPELRLNCIRDFTCFAYPTTMELPTPRASISFELVVRDGQVTYRDATATFTTSSTDGNARSAATAIGAAMTEKLNGEATIKSAVGAALDSIIRQTANLGTFPVAAVTIGGGLIQVRPGCPLD
ncbi:MAG: hypothetical protein R3B48_10520 [Kofleriaceae bacterium]